MRARVRVHRKVEYQHALEKDDEIILDLALKACRIKGVYPGACGTRGRCEPSDLNSE